MCIRMSLGFCAKLFYQLGAKGSAQEFVEQIPGLRARAQVLAVTFLVARRDGRESPLRIRCSPFLRSSVALPTPPPPPPPSPDKLALPPSEEMPCRRQPRSCALRTRRCDCQGLPIRVYEKERESVCMGGWT